MHRTYLISRVDPAYAIDGDSVSNFLTLLGNKLIRRDVRAISNNVIERCNLKRSTVGMLKVCEELWEMES